MKTGSILSRHSQLDWESISIKPWINLPYGRCFAPAFAGMTCILF